MGQASCNWDQKQVILAAAAGIFFLVGIVGTVVISGTNVERGTPRIRSPGWGGSHGSHCYRVHGPWPRVRQVWVQVGGRRACLMHVLMGNRADWA